MKVVKTLLATAAAAVMLASAANAQVILKASHQFPGGKGDPRDEMVQIIARDVKAANVGVEIQVYPGASLFKANDQWNAMVNGQLDMSSFPLDYASGKVRAFGATLMPGLVRSHDRAAKLNNSPFMKEINAQIEKAGVVVLADAWLARRGRFKEGAVSASRKTLKASRSAPPAQPSRRCGRKPVPRSSRSRRTRSTTRCRPASPTRPTLRPAVSCRSVSTSR